MGKILEDLSAIADTNNTDHEEQLALFEIEEQERKPGSVVKAPYKTKYKNRALQAGIRGKAAKRSTWDWIAQEMAKETLTKKAKTDVEALYDFLHANGVDTANWTSRTPGWEGRLRMTGGLALRRIVAERGTLFYKDGTEVDVPEAELARLMAKYDI